ncbi:hypothetical protein Bpfe_013398, partial [Biomphalaria pfeifferi]
DDNSIDVSTTGSWPLVTKANITSTQRLDIDQTPLTSPPHSRPDSLAPGQHTHV